MKTSTSDGRATSLDNHMSTGPTSLFEIVKFTMLAALFAMLGDAAIAHAMLWGNDPYWTYWITDGLLMSTVFGVGTIWFGTGIGRGAVLTAVHVLALTIYYWTFSPIGLPGAGEWLDLERTWITGLPVHFCIYYLGYLLALWLWHRHKAFSHESVPDTKRKALTALSMAAGTVVALGLVQTILKGEFPGVTWFVVRIAVSFPFILAWFAIAGRTRVSNTIGGVVLAFLLSSYTHYLAPVGLPNVPLRLFAENPPPVDVHWLSYRDEFLVLLPFTLVMTLLAFFIGSHYIGTRADVASRPTVANSSRNRWVLIAPAVVLFIIGIVVYNYTGPESKRFTITAINGAGANQDNLATGETSQGAAALKMVVENQNTHRTPLKPHDKISLTATVAAADGSMMEIVSKTPIVSDPQGRFTTWAGVGYDVWHHGRSGIGTDNLPPTHSNVAVYALGSLSVAGKTIANEVPIHVMTSDNNGGGLELHVGHSDFPLAAIPDGYLRVTWPAYQSDYSRTFDYARYGWGGAWLIVLLVLTFITARAEKNRCDMSLAA